MVPQPGQYEPRCSCHSRAHIPERARFKLLYVDGKAELAQESATAEGQAA